MLVAQPPSAVALPNPTSASRQGAAIPSGIADKTLAALASQTLKDSSKAAGVSHGLNLGGATAEGGCATVLGFRLLWLHGH
jgi:hypothetical protein